MNDDKTNAFVRLVGPTTRGWNGGSREGYEAVLSICELCIYVKRFCWHDHNKTVNVFDTRFIIVAHEASIDIWTTTAPECVFVVQTFTNFSAALF